MRGRCAAAAAENADAERGGFAGEEREVFGGRARIDDAVAFALRETGIRHAADAQVVDIRELLKDRKERLRSQCAICADDLDVFVLEALRGVGGKQVAIGAAL